MKLVPNGTNQWELYTQDEEQYGGVIILELIKNKINQGN